MIKNVSGNPILVISHIADIDGMGSVILAKSYYQGVDFILVDNHELVEALSDDYSSYDRAYLCDLSITESVVEVIDQNESLRDKLYHFDHHPVLLETIPSYVNSVAEIHGKKTCGTERFYHYLLSLDSKLDTPFYHTLVEAIRSNDTWDHDGDFVLGSTLATLHSLLGSLPFISMILEMDATLDFQLSSVYLNLVKANEEVKLAYALEEREHLVCMAYQDFTMGLVVCEQYRSFIGNELCTLHPEIDFCLLVNFHRRSCSLRSVKEHVHCGEIARSFQKDGGGHPKAAGFRLDASSFAKLQPYLDLYFQHIE